MLEERSHRRSCVQDFGGPQCIRIPKSILGCTMLSKGWETIVEGRIALKSTNYITSV